MRHRAGWFVWIALGGFLASGCMTQQEKSEEGWISLFNGKDLSGWELVHPHGFNSWSVEDGVLVNTRPADGEGTDIRTEQEFGDCELHVEFMVPEGSNSGVFLQEQYEVQVFDSYGQPPRLGGCGAIYNQVAPLENVSKPAGEWQTFDIVFHQPAVTSPGKVTRAGTITVFHNGVKVIDNAAIQTPTGGPFKQRPVNPPGPVLLQGDHGTVSYRNIRIRPLD